MKKIVEKRIKELEAQVKTTVTNANNAVTFLNGAIAECKVILVKLSETKNGKTNKNIVAKPNKQ